MARRAILSCLATLLFAPAALAAQAVQYTPLSDAARKEGRLQRYEGASTKKARVALGDYSLDVEVPETARAYDVIPVRYKLTRPSKSRRLAVEAVAFEDPAKAGDKPLYDMAIPGKMNIKIEYLGSLSADFLDDKYIPLTPDPKTPISPFPPFKRDEMVRSSTVREARVVWFKFRLTNVGDTVLDPEGFGAGFAHCRLTKLDKEGKEEWTADTMNQRDRHLQYLYPGDSVEQWVTFYTPKLGGPWIRGLREGDYLVDYRYVYRYHRGYTWGANIWSGVEFARLRVPIKVAKSAADTPVKADFAVTDKDEKMPGDFDLFEEFMTSFRIHPAGSDKKNLEDILYLQVAPWTKHVAVKLILADPKEIAVARIPFRVTDETLKISFNKKNVMVLKDGGAYKPVIIAMELPAMRSGWQLGPFPEKHMRENLREMKELGVNVISNSAGSWWLGEITGRKGVEIHSACYKFFYDVLVREFDMKVLGWSVYPPSSYAFVDHVTPLLGRKPEVSHAKGGYVGSHRGQVDMGDPQVPEIIAAWTVYNFKRWGDTWYQTKDRRVPIEMEDTWGWMRDDINLRHYLGPLGLDLFRKWVKRKYGTLKQVNKAWSSDYKSWEEIDPQKDQGAEGDDLPHEPVYNKKDHPFHDWSPAVEDWDIFRTHLRMEILEQANKLIRKKIRGAEIALRTEGANLVIEGGGKGDNMHMRHVFYSQRRNAMVFDVVKKTRVLHFYSDYTTLPYTEEEWRKAQREMVEAGVIPMFLPQFDHMRDILLNPHHGRQYQTHYNLDKPSKGMMVHCLMAAYPWWKATYEEGGAPGIIWSDFDCDGVATETQKRELKLLREHFDKMEND